MSNIEWKDGAVCLGNGKQWYFNDGRKHNRPLVNIVGNEFVSFDFITGSDDFQLNEIRQGDYIEAPELDTEQKYNDAVEVFRLLGFVRGGQFALSYSDFMAHQNEDALICSDGLLMGVASSHNCCKRKITRQQLMAIGKLKRAMIERDESNPSELTSSSELKSSDFESSAIGVSNDWTDKHYNIFYQLSEDDIKAGKIKVDAYFVNRMWKINSWEDTGAGFHILKTLPRIANNKNSLKRELVALKKQVDILCKLHGVDDDTN